jgi:hypothetical protein
VETQLLCLRIYLAFAAEGLAKRYLVYYHTIRAYGIVAENGALPADEDTLAQIVRQLGAGAHASVPHTRARPARTAPHRTRARPARTPPLATRRHAPPCWQQVSTSSTSSPRSRRTATPSTFET